LQLDLEAKFTLTIGENVNVSLVIDELSLSVDHEMAENPWNATVKTSTWKLPVELAAAEKAAQFAINSLFTDGLVLEPLIH